MGMGDFNAKTQAYLENHWKQVICKRICVEIGKQINVALSDSSMSMVEISEIEGYKNRNIISALTERLKPMLSKSLSTVDESGMYIYAKKISSNNYLEALKNYQGNNAPKVWVLIDDIDAKYVDDDEHQQRIGAFFSALRSLAFSVSGLRLRASVRTDVWRNLRRMEDQDKLRQYIIEIVWNDDNLKTIISRRILSYLKRHKFKLAGDWNENKNYHDLFDQVFYGKFQWGTQTIEPFVPLKFLAGGRPRWMGQLAKLAGAKAGFSRISQNHLFEAMSDFGQEKISDIQKEHFHQFSLIDKLILSFRGGKREYTKYQLLQNIEKEFVKKFQQIPLVNGYPFKNTEQLAKFLFEIDFLTAHHAAKNDYILYSNDPDYFDTQENNQNKIQWAIHSSYRNFLQVK